MPGTENYQLKKPIQESYNIHNTPLSTVQSAKYLGVLIDSKISWNTECSVLCKKANSSLAFLQPIVHSCLKRFKERCFNTFVRPTLEYGCSVWDPHKTTQIDNLEKINNRDL